MPFRKRKKNYGHTLFISMIMLGGILLIAFIGSVYVLQKGSDNVESMTLYGPAHSLKNCNWRCIGAYAENYEDKHPDKFVADISTVGSRVRFSKNQKEDNETGYKLIIVKRP